jgi:hypothetical protein
LSISSMKTMPLLGVGQRLRLRISSSLTSLPASSSTSSFSASPIFSLRVLRGLAHLREQALQLLGHLFHAGRAQDLERGLGVGHLDLDLLVVERAFAQALAHHLAGGVVARARLRRAHLGARAAAPARRGCAPRRRPRRGHACAHLALALLLDGHVDQVADDGVDVLADVAHLGELGRLDLDEGRVGQPRQAARDLGLAHAGGADHQDVLRRDLAAQLLVDLLAAPAVAQRDGHRALGFLADDVAVEFGDDLLRRHAHVRLQRLDVWFWLV